MSGEARAEGSGPRIGVCLSSGFFGFFAHAGFALAMEELGLRPAAAAGSSAGAIVAAMWASGRSGAEMRERLAAIRRSDFWDPTGPIDWLRGPPGILRGDAMERLLDEHLACATFEACRFPVAVNAFDIAGRRAVVFSSGPLAPAVRASASLPGLFRPALVGGRWHLDGGLVEKTPVAWLLERSDIDLVIIHHLRSAAPSLPRNPGALQILRAAIGALRGRVDEATLDAARRSGRRLLIVEPDVPHVGPFALDRGPDAFEAARSHARRALDGLGVHTTR